MNSALPSSFLFASMFSLSFLGHTTHDFYECLSRVTLKPATISISSSYVYILLCLRLAVFLVFL